MFVLRFSSIGRVSTRKYLVNFAMRHFAINYLIFVSFMSMFVHPIGMCKLWRQLHICDSFMSQYACSIPSLALLAVCCPPHYVAQITDAL